jgi:predicted transcriptional regulator
MPALKTETLTIRLSPDTKATLRETAEQEHRSLSNMLEVMIRDYSRRYPVHGFNQQDASRHGSNR